MISIFSENSIFLRGLKREPNGFQYRSPDVRRKISHRGQEWKETYNSVVQPYSSDIKTELYLAQAVGTF